MAWQTGGKPSAERIPLVTVEKVLGLYKETYYDLNIRYFHEKLRDKHDIELSYTGVQKGLRGAGGQAAQAGAAPAETTATADGWDAAAHGSQQTSVVQRRSVERPDCDSG